MLAFDFGLTHFNRNRQLTCYTSLICIHQWLFNVVQYSYYQNLITWNVSIRLQTNSFQQKSTINLLYFINMPPLVVIYVVQYSYYQNLITQNVSIRLWTNSFQQKSTINLLYIINMHPLVVIYVVQYSYYQNLITWNVSIRLQTNIISIEIDN